MALFIREDGVTKNAEIRFKDDLEKVGFKLAEEETSEPIQEELKKKPKTKK